MSGALLASFRNEFRALLPLWGTSTLLMLAAAVTDWPELKGIAILAYGLGSWALGAHAFGHEYSHRTLSLVLTQPIDRRWLLAIKLTTAMSLVTLLGLAGYLTILQDDGNRAPATPAQIARLVWMIAVVVAPALTLLCRSTLAGAIFSGSLTGMIALAGGLIGWYRFDTDAAAIDRFQLLFFWRSMPPFFLAAGLVLWQRFMRLEAIEGRGREFHLPQWLRRSDDSAPARRLHPVWQLVAKELRLQQMVLAIAGIYAAIAAVVLVRHALNPAFSVEVLIPLTILYAALLALLAGALASAEERHLRTLEPQLLLPMSSWRQWLVKAGVVLTIALSLAVVLPAAVMLLVQEPRLSRAPWTAMVATAIVLSSASLYVSSLTSSGVRALTASAPFIAGGLFLLSWSGTATRAMLQGFFASPAWAVSRHAGEWSFLAALVLSACFAAGMVRFAHANHRAADRSYRRVGVQVACVAAFIALASAATTILDLWPA